MKDGDVKLAKQMNELFEFISRLDLNRLKEFEKELCHQVNQYTAIRIRDGYDYFKKKDDLEARYDRILSVISLINTFILTQTKILS